MSNERVVNLTDKPLRNFAPGDTLYVRKIINGFSIHYFCEFVKIERGLVHVAPVSCEDKHVTPPPTTTARASNCYLWGQGDKGDWPMCHWFYSLDTPAGVKREEAA